MFQLENHTAKLSNLNLRAIAHPSSDEIGRLSELAQREITLSLYPPSAEDQLKQDLAGMDEDEE